MAHMYAHVLFSGLGDPAIFMVHPEFAEMYFTPAQVHGH